MALVGADAGLLITKRKALRPAHHAVMLVLRVAETLSTVLTVALLACAFVRPPASHLQYV